jgi:hypothetical protein
MALSLVPWLLSPVTPNPALRGAAISMNCTPQNLEGVEPGEDAASSPRKNRGENTMRSSKLSENLT